MFTYNNGDDTLFVPVMNYIGSALDMGAYEFDPTTGIKSNPIESIPQEFALKQNYPNPFNPITNIEFSLPKAELVSLKIYNLLGQEVATLVSDKLTPGDYKYTWDAGHLASGVYLYEITAGSFVQTRKMILLR